jgi:hypothetical protein
MTRLLVMHSPPQEGWDNLVGTYWVLMSDGKRLRHTTERQGQITITLAKDHRVEDYFEPPRTETTE